VLSLRGNLRAPGGRGEESSPELMGALSRLTFTVNQLPLVALHLVGDAGRCVNRPTGTLRQEGGGAAVGKGQVQRH
jgi:hypothetical protein